MGNEESIQTDQVLKSLNANTKGKPMPYTPKSYVLLTDNDPTDLAINVRAYWTRGWRPCGGVSVTYCGRVESGPCEGNNLFLYAQAMIDPSMMGPSMVGY